MFQLVPEVAKKDDTVGAFSQIPKGFVYAEDPRIYIHCNIEELGDEEIKIMYKSFICDNSENVKPEHKIIETLGFTKILYIPEFPKDVIRIVLSRVHGEFFWLDEIHKITKEDVKAVTGLPTTGKRPDKNKKVSNDLVMNLTGATSDRRSLRVNDVIDINVRFVSMILGYKSTHANGLNSVSSLCIKSAYDMVMDNVKIDICEWLKDELIDNLGKIKKDKKMSKVQDEINKLADNFVNSPDTLSVFELKITTFEEELLKLEREKERIVNKAKHLRLKLSPRLDYLASLWKEISEALI